MKLWGDNRERTRNLRASDWKEEEEEEEEEEEKKKNKLSTLSPVPILGIFTFVRSRPT